MRNNKNEFNLWGDWNVCTFELLWLFFGKGVVFSKITPSLFTLKEGSTSHPDPLTLRGEGGNRPTRCCICPTCPSPAGGSLTHSQALALSKRARDVTAPSRCSEPLRSKDGGPSKVSPCFAGWDRLAKGG